MSDEIWKPIPGYESLYEVSDHGQVKRTQTGLILRYQINHKGYACLELHSDHRRAVFRVHALVMLAFIGPRPEGAQINHKNGTKTDNQLSNLEYCTPHENMKHASDILGRNRGEKQHNAKITEEDVKKIRDMRNRGMLYREIGASFNINRQTVSRICRRKNWKHVD